VTLAVPHSGSKPQGSWTLYEKIHQSLKIFGMPRYCGSITNLNSKSAFGNPSARLFFHPLFTDFQCLPALCPCRPPMASHWSVLQLYDPGLATACWTAGATIGPPAQWPGSEGNRRTPSRLPVLLHSRPVSLPPRIFFLMFSETSLFRWSAQWWTCTQTGRR
jgi:hypothetical protein